MKPSRPPSPTLFALIVIAATLLYSAALIANVTAGAVVGILVGMFISLALFSIHRIWHRNVLLLLAVGSWALATLVVRADCLVVRGPACSVNPLEVSWFPSLFYALCWLAWTASAATGPGREH